jgi:hypothetical protein
MVARKRLNVTFYVHRLFCLPCTRHIDLVLLEKIRGSFQKFCTLYVLSLKMNLFYKIHFQAFNVVSIVLYHSGPTFGQVLYSCLNAFVVYASDYSGHLIRHLLNASEAFRTEWFLQFWEQVKVWWAQSLVCVVFTTRETIPNKCTPNHLFTSSLLQHCQCCTP